MVDQNDTGGVENFADVPPGADEKHTARVSRSGPGLRLGIVTGVAALVAGVVGMVVYNGVIAPSRVTTAPQLDDTPGGRRQAESAEYQRSLEESNDRRAELAREQNSTFVATPEGIPESREPPQIRSPRPWDTPGTEIADNVPAVREISRPNIPRVAETPRREVRPREEPAKPYVNPWNERILQQASQVTGAWLITSSNTGVFKTDEEESAATSVGRENGYSDSERSGHDKVLIPAGTILYGQTLTRTTSDAAAPIVVEVVSGKWKGSKLIGGYTVQPGTEKMVIAFTSMTMGENGDSVEVNAFAVDGRSAETAVASDVKKRYLQRYAPILGAAFLSGFANSASRVGSTVTDTGSSTTFAISAPNLTQSLWAGAGTAADAIAGDVMRNVPKGPLIILAEGWPMGILFLSPVKDDRR